MICAELISKSVETLRATSKMRATSKKIRNVLHVKKFCQIKNGNYLCKIMVRYFNFK